MKGEHSADKWIRYYINNRGFGSQPQRSQPESSQLRSSQPVSSQLKKSSQQRSSLDQGFDPSIEYLISLRLFQTNKTSRERFTTVPLQKESCIDGQIPNLQKVNCEKNAMQPHCGSCCGEGSGGIVGPFISDPPNVKRTAYIQLPTFRSSSIEYFFLEPVCTSSSLSPDS